MAEEVLRDLLCLNKIVMKEDLEYLYNIDEERLNQYILAYEDLDTINTILFSKKYDIDLKLVQRFSDILDDNDLFMIYFYYLVLSKYGKVTPYVIDKLEGIRCVKHFEIMEVYRTVYEYINPDCELENIVNDLVSYAEVIFESSIDMQEEYRSFILNNLKEFYALKENFKNYEKEKDLPFNQVFQNKTFTGVKLSRSRTKKINHLITKFRVSKNNVAS